MSPYCSYSRRRSPGRMEDTRRRGAEPSRAEREAVEEA